jgi:release factor glutamine methyltransferase
MMNDLSGWLETARQQLSAVSDQPSLEAQTLLAGLLGQSRAWIFTYPETILAPEQLDRLNAQVNRRLQGEPLPYLLGQWEFYGLAFEVTPAVLIPRPESELLVDLGREWLQAHPQRRRAVDVGTGSGCIAAALAYWTPDLDIFAVDLSPEALAVAQGNFTRLGLHSRVHPLQGDLLSSLQGPFDLICANLPYIPSLPLEELDVAQHEPRMALDGGPDGLRLIERLLAQATTRLAPGGRILLEIEFSQGNSGPTLARHYFPRAVVTLKNDLAGLARCVVVDNA